MACPRPATKASTHAHVGPHLTGAARCTRLLADVEIRKATHGESGLQQALRAIVDASGGLVVDWPIRRVLEAGDDAVGTSALEDLYDKMKGDPMRPGPRAALAQHGRGAGRIRRFDCTTTRRSRTSGTRSCGHRGTCEAGGLIAPSWRTRPADPTSRRSGRKLRKLLFAVFGLFALLAVNSIYLGSVTLIEWLRGATYEDYFYQCMFLVHTSCWASLIIVPVVVYGAIHISNAHDRPNRRAVKVGLCALSRARSCCSQPGWC